MPAIYDLQTHFAAQIQQAESESSRVYEALIGIVTDNKDPSKIGRVKVKIPVLSDDDATFWLPIVILGAGKNRGWFFIPEPDDEVLVMFEHGDVNRGVVIGSLWNGVDAPPDNNKDGANDRRVIQSRGGSRIVLDDGPSPCVIIQDGAGKGRITIDTKNNKIVIEALDGDVCFQAPQGELKIVAKTVDLKALQGGVEINAGSTMAWGSDGAVKISGDGGVGMSGTTHNNNNGVAQAPQAPTASPVDVDDPYGS